MYIELDMRNLDYDRLVEVLEVANKLGAEVVRSYISINQQKILKLHLEQRELTILQKFVVILMKILMLKG